MIDAAAERMPDQELARRAGDGDERALELLYARHGAALLSFCRHLMGSREEAEDVVQQTFVRAMNALRGGTVTLRSSALMGGHSSPNCSGPSRTCGVSAQFRSRSFPHWATAPSTRHSASTSTRWDRAGR